MADRNASTEGEVMGIEVVSDKTGDYFRRLESAIGDPGGGGERATNFLVSKVVASMPGPGAAAFDSDGDGRLDKFSPSNPGTPPGVRNNATLRNSIANARLGPLKWGTGTKVVYAPIQEFGGTINHPGGTHYITVGAGKAAFITKEKASQIMSSGRNVKKTKPHTITLPPRPFLRPAFRNNRDQMVKQFIAGVQAKMGGS